MSRIVLEQDPVLVGFIANTHGTVAPSVVKALGGCDLIVHAGDIGSEAALDALRGAAVVAAIRGNSDRLPPLCDLPEALEIVTHDVVIVVVHNHALMEWPPAPRVRAVVSGLWHQPSVVERDGVLLVSPGCGAACAWAPASIAKLAVRGACVEPSILRLKPPSNDDGAYAGSSTPQGVS